MRSQRPFFRRHLVSQEEYSLVVVVQPRRKNSQGLGPNHCNPTLEVICNARVYRGAQLGNMDYHMLVGTFKLKLKLPRPAQNSRPLDSCRLKDPTIASAYKCSISNKFNALADAARSDWKHFSEEVTQSVACTAGLVRRRPKKSWIYSDTLKIIDQRRSTRLSRNLA